MNQNKYRNMRLPHRDNNPVEYDVLYLLSERYEAVLRNSSSPSSQMFSQLEAEYGIRYKLVPDFRELLTDADLDILEPEDSFLFRIFLPYSETESYITGSFAPELLGVEAASVVFRASNISDDYLEEVFKELLLNNYIDLSVVSQYNLGHKRLDVPSGLRRKLGWGPSFKGGSKSVMAKPSDYTSTDEDKIKLLRKAIKLYKSEGETKEVAAMMDDVIKSFSRKRIAQLLKEYILTSTDHRNKEVMDNCFNKNKSGARSDVHVKIVPFEKIDDCKTNDGLYRIRFTRWSDMENAVVYEKTLHFLHKPSCVIYMMHLIDRKKRGNKAGPLDVRKYKDVFCRIFDMTYFKGLKDVSEDAETAFERISPSLDNKAARDEAIYGKCYADINTAVRQCFPDGKSCKAYLLFETDYLGVRPELIELPEIMQDIILK